MKTSTAASLPSSWRNGKPIGWSSRSVALLLTALAERCPRFGGARIHKEARYAPYSTAAVAFTHIPKAGGTSYQAMLQHDARAAHKVVCNVKANDPYRYGDEDFAVVQNVSKTADCEVLIGHSSYATESQLLEWHGRGDRGTHVTMFREPASRAESLFRYAGGRGREFVAEVLERNGSLLEEYAASISPTGSLMANWSSPTRRAHLRGVKMHAPTANFFGHEGELSLDKLAELMAFIAHRYAAVGVLERSAASVEALRCRVPWVSARSLPHTAHNSQTWRYPVNLTADAALMDEHVAVEAVLYEWANLLLSDDLICCCTEQTERSYNATAVCRKENRVAVRTKKWTARKEKNENSSVGLEPLDAVGYMRPMRRYL